MLRSRSPTGRTAAVSQAGCACAHVAVAQCQGSAFSSQAHPGKAARSRSGPPLPAPSGCSAWHGPAASLAAAQVKHRWHCAVQASYKRMRICIARCVSCTEAAASCQPGKVALRAKPNNCSMSCLEDVQADGPCPILHIWVPAQSLKLHSGRLERVVMGKFQAEFVGVPLVRCTGRTLQAVTQLLLNVQQAPCLVL